MLLLRGATSGLRLSFFPYEVSIHAPLARSNSFDNLVLDSATVSIHAPLARSNCYSGGSRSRDFRFNTCSSCEEQPRKVSPGTISKRFNTCSSCEEQRGTVNSSGRSLRFQYMLLLRGATIKKYGMGRYDGVSIHAPLARSNFEPYVQALRDLVSIHAPLARSNSTFLTSAGSLQFQYMLLLRGATRLCGMLNKQA